MTIIIQGIYRSSVQVDLSAVNTYLDMRDLPQPSDITFDCTDIPDQLRPGYIISLATIKLHDLDGTDPYLRAGILDDCGESLLNASILRDNDNPLISYSAN